MVKGPQRDGFVYAYVTPIKVESDGGETFHVVCVNAVGPERTRDDRFQMLRSRLHDENKIAWDLVAKKQASVPERTDACPTEAKAVEWMQIGGFADTVFFLHVPGSAEDIKERLHFVRTLMGTPLPHRVSNTMLERLPAVVVPKVSPLFQPESLLVMSGHAVQSFSALYRRAGTQLSLTDVVNASSGLLEQSKLNPYVVLSFPMTAEILIRCQVACFVKKADGSKHEAAPATDSASSQYASASDALEKK